MYRPSGEYFGLPSYAALPDVMLCGSAFGFVSDTTQRSLLVDLAGTESWLETYVSSELSGEKAYCTGPPSCKVGASKAPGVTSRTPPEATSSSRTCVRVPSFQSVQWRYRRPSAICAFSVPLCHVSAIFLLHASSAHSG